MIYVIARAEVEPGRFEEYLKALEKLVPAVRSEEGCVGYEPCRDLKVDGDERFVTIIEMWESEAHWRRHMSTPHMAEFRSEAGPLRVGNTVYSVKPL